MQRPKDRASLGKRDTSADGRPGRRATPGNTEPLKRKPFLGLCVDHYASFSHILERRVKTRNGGVNFYDRSLNATDQEGFRMPKIRRGIIKVRGEYKSTNYIVLEVGSIIILTFP